VAEEPEVITGSSALTEKMSLLEVFEYFDENICSLARSINAAQRNFFQRSAPRAALEQRTTAASAAAAGTRKPANLLVATRTAPSNPHPTKGGPRPRLRDGRRVWWRVVSVVGSCPVWGQDRAPPPTGGGSSDGPPPQGGAWVFVGAWVLAGEGVCGFD
jgi:hypothetical protein